MFQDDVAAAGFMLQLFQLGPTDGASGAALRAEAGAAVLFGEYVGVAIDDPRIALGVRGSRCRQRS